MSGFIPMISDSPPPFDNDGGFDDWDDDDEFGNFTAAESSNIVAINSPGKITNSVSGNTSTSALQTGSHLIADSNVSFANFDKFDGIANVVNAENDNNLNIVHEEIPDHPNLKQLRTGEENIRNSSEFKEHSQKGHSSEVCKTTNSPIEAHCCGEFSQYSVSDSGIICSNDISPVPHSDNLTSEFCDKSNSSDIDDSFCDSQIVLDRHNKFISNHDAESSINLQNESSCCRNELAAAVELKLEEDISMKIPESCNHCISSEIDNSAKWSVDHNSIINETENTCSTMLDKGKLQHNGSEKGSCLSLPDEEIASTEETARISDSNLSQKDGEDSVIMNNCSSTEDIDTEGQNFHVKSFSKSINEAQNAKHIFSQHSKHIDMESISNNLNNANILEEAEEVVCNVFSGHSQNAVQCSNTSDHHHSDSDNSAGHCDTSYTKNKTEFKVESDELESVNNSEIDSQNNTPNRTEKCGSDECSGELTADKCETDSIDSFSDFSTALSSEKYSEDCHVVSEHSSETASKPQDEKFVDKKMHNIPSSSDISDTGGDFDTISSTIQDSQSIDFDPQSADENWASFSLPTSETENTFTSEVFVSHATDDSAGADKDWANFGNTAQLSSDVKFDEDDDFAEFSAFESPPTEEFSHQTLQEGLENYVCIVDRCFSTPPLYGNSDSNTVNSLILLLDSSKEVHDLSKSENEKNCDNSGSCCQIWKCLKKEDKGDALTYQWMDSSGNKKFFKTIHVDTQNMLFGHKKSSVPIFASGLGMLEPTKGPPEAQKYGGQLTQVDESKEIDNQSRDDNISTVQFDWMGSGLVNPLEGNGGRLDLDFLAINEASSSGKTTVFDSEFLKKSELELKVGPQLEDLLTSIKPTCFESTKSEGNLSGEGNKIITSLPDLSFMKAKVLMFPLLKNKKY